MTAIAALLLSAVSPVVAAPGDIARFAVGGSQIAIPYPKDYCAPNADETRVLEKLALADPESVFGTSFHQCDHRMAPAVANDYSIIVAPKAFLTRSIEFSELVRVMGPSYEAGVAFDDRGMIQSGSERLGKVLGAPIDIAGTVRPFGHDDVCLYAGGVVTYRFGGGSYSQAMGACTTTVSGRVLTIYRISRRIDAAGVAAIMREARAIAKSARALDQI